MTRVPYLVLVLGCVCVVTIAFAQPASAPLRPVPPTDAVDTIAKQQRRLYVEVQRLSEQIGPGCTEAGGRWSLVWDKDWQVVSVSCTER